MTELYHPPQEKTIFCPICHHRVGDLELHVRTYHPKRHQFYVYNRDIKNQSTLADICLYCNAKTLNILAHVRECHPDQYYKYLFGAEKNEN